MIHMNARLYDPEIGRFLSADSYIQEPGLSQNFNRYIYVMNNPLKYNDPSGHFINFIIGAIIMIVSQFIDNPYIRMIGMVVGMAMMGGAFFGEGLFTAAAGGSGASGAFITVGGTSFQVAAGEIALAAMNGAAIGAVVGGATTGTLKGALKGAMFGAISGAAAGYVGHGGNGGGRLFDSDGMTALAHGATQGAISEMRGGNFKSGFVGAFVASLSPAAMVHLFNAENHTFSREKLEKSNWRHAGNTSFSADGSSLMVDAGQQIAIELTSQAFPPTEKFYVKVSAWPIDGSGNFTNVHASPEWFESVKYVGQTGQFLGVPVTATYVLDTVVPGRYRWHIEVPPQAATHDNSMWREVNVYVSR